MANYNRYVYCGGAIRMGAQIKRMSIATLAGLAVAIMIAAIQALTAGRLDPIDPLQPGNAGIMGYWIGNLGWIPFIAGLIAMFIGFRRSGVGVSIASFFGALIGLIVVICTLVAIVASAYPVDELPFAAPGAERDAFVQHTMASCFRTRRAAAAYRQQSDADIQKYCRCTAEATAGKITREDVAYQQKNGTLSPALASRMMQVAAACEQDLRK